MEKELFHTPEVLTKELKIQVCPSGQRRIRLSTNFLHGFGFTPGTRLQATTRERGFDLVPCPAGTGPWKIHERNYPQRRNNPREALIDIQANSFISQNIPSTVERLHFTLQRNRIEVRPVYAPLFHIRKSMKEHGAKELRGFLALSSGLDAIAFSQAGFRIEAVLDWRPPEARDTRDLSETGICTFLANHQPRFVFNEDLTTVNAVAVAERLKAVHPLALLSIGIQCDDFSSAKSPALRRLECQQMRPGSRELGYYAMRLIDEIKPATLLVENVPGYFSSESHAVLGAVLTRMGYYVKSNVFNAADYGALTSRRRCYLVASCWPGFEFPQPLAQRNTKPLGEIFGEEVRAFKDLSHTKTIAAAKESGRDRFCSLHATTAPTVLKSQARRTKDSLYFTDDAGRILFPSVKALKQLHGFGDDLRLDGVSEELAIEQIGQGIDLPLHYQMAAKLVEHIRLNAQRN